MEKPIYIVLLGLRTLLSAAIVFFGVIIILNVTINLDGLNIYANNPISAFVIGIAMFIGGLISFVIFVKRLQVKFIEHDGKQSYNQYFK